LVEARRFMANGWLVALAAVWLIGGAVTGGARADAYIALPAPRLSGTLSLEEALATRRSVRRFTDAALVLADLGQMLWAAQGVTDPRGRRTAPSAGALYPLELYVMATRVRGLAPGLYRYRADGHALVPVAAGDLAPAVAVAAFNQDWMREAAAIAVFAGVVARTAKKYRRRAEFYVHAEVGHAAMNLSLQALALGLGSTMVGGFPPGRIGEILGLPDDTEPMLLVPFGHPRPGKNRR
jgi:SagB-type dehydrogenase family enzyme